ncbi:MAG: hypothetical protein WCD79_22410 [Chthoniobacteraceae bacterium]
MSQAAPVIPSTTIFGALVATAPPVRGDLFTNIQRALWSPLGDPVIVSMMLILLLVLSQRSLCVWDRKVEKRALAGLICGYLAGAGLQFVAHYAIYSHWVSRLLLIGFVCAVLKRAVVNLSGTRKAAILLLIAAVFTTAAKTTLLR